MDVYHIGGDKQAYRDSIVIVPGSVGRGEEIADMLIDKQEVPAKRKELTAYTGFYQGTKITVQVGQMGPSSTDIVVREIIDLGGRYILRVGSCGALQPNINIGSMLIAESAYPDETVSSHYHDWEKDAPVDLLSVEACKKAAQLLNYEHHTGPFHTKASLERELQRGPKATEHRKFMHNIKRQGYVGSEMEISTIATLAYCLVEQHPIDEKIFEKIGVSSLEEAQDMIYKTFNHIPRLDEEELHGLGRILGLHQRIIRKDPSAPDPLEVRAGCVCVAVGGYDPQKKEIVPYGNPEQIKKGEEDIIFMALESAHQWAKLLNITQ